MTRPFLLMLLLVAALFAGCASTDAPAPVVVDPVAQVLGSDHLAAANATVDLATPFLLSAQAGPDAPLTAFIWTVPEGAVIEYEPFPGFSFEMIVLDVVPVGIDGLALDEYAILAYSLGRTATAVGGALATPTSGFSGDLLGTTPEETAAEPLAPQLFFMAGEGLEEGDQIAFVVAARSAEARPFGLLMAVVDEDTEDPSEDAAELLDGRLAVPLEANGRGAGFQYAMYLQLNLFFPPGFNEVYVVQTKAIQVTDDLPNLAEPVASARDRTVEATFPSAGHTEAIVVALASPTLVVACPQAGTFSIESDLHGTTTTFQNLLAGSGPAVLATGLPIYVGTGAGPGPSTTSLRLTEVSACGVDLIEVAQLDLGATLDELTGVPGQSYGFAFEGLTGNLPPALADHGDLVLSAGGAPMRLHGAAAGLPDGPLGRSA
ncbi:MAG: hypothetical protein QOJ26_1460 [Thermoplasmata archaeon]|nr:hypothetical protein [Thermoplasmata archaeon]